jgi:2-polyprenyl-3-methyl-5-hydroxy-6-metoxy-1,4-benzoquinol methylase
MEAVSGPVYLESMPCYPVLHDLMRSYQLKDLRDVSPGAFRERLNWFMGIKDFAMEGFTDPDRQSPVVVDFHWGHWHDFGEFVLDGRMGKHHMSMPAVFIDYFQSLPMDLRGKRVLDIGCWTGGTSLLLCAMGAEVVAVEEVRKYAECVGYLREAFGLERLRVERRSFYDCLGPEYQDRFDYVLMAGVLHHLSDPKLALRIAFNSLRDGGCCLLETMVAEEEKIMRCFRSDVAPVDGGLPRWNGLLFLPEIFIQVLEEVGYEVVGGPAEILFKTPEPRLYTVAKRVRHRDMFRNGLSVRGIR